MLILVAVFVAVFVVAFAVIVLVSNGVIIVFDSQLRYFFYLICFSCFRTLNPPPLTIPKDTSKLKKHLSLVCDRLGKGAKLSAISSPGEENANDALLEEEEEEEEEGNEERKENNAPTTTAKRGKGGKKRSGVGGGGDAGGGGGGAEGDGGEQPVPALRGKGLPPIGGKGLPPIKGGGGGGGKRGKADRDYDDGSGVEMV